ncbi:MAG: hypothetical protein ABIG87_02090 [Patescibacteria group bacterium]
MLNPFPDLLTFSFIAPLVLRAVVGAYFLKQAWFEFKERKNRKNEIISGLKIVGLFGGLCIIIGFYTQIASIVLLAVIIAEIILQSKKKKLEEIKLDFYILLIAILISIIFTGAGFLAIDLPL